MKILIMGGAGAFGSFYAQLLAKNCFEVCISDKDIEAGKAFCKKNCFDWIEKEASLKGFDIVIVSVPNEAAPAVIAELGPRLAEGALLFDFCSVKKNSVKALEKLSKLDLELASIHPLHGPRVKSIAGYPIACIRIKAGKKLETIKDFFAKNGAEFFFTTAKKHDKIISAVQGLTHYVQFISAATLRQLKVDLKESMQFGSPNYHLFLSLMSRVILQNPEMYAQIQLSNPENKKMRSAFRKQALEFDKLCSKHDLKSLEKKIVESGQQFKGQETFLFESDRIVNAINYFIESMRHRVGKKFLVQNLLTGKFHNGTIKAVNSHEIVMGEHGNETKIALHNIRILSKEEMREWKKRSLKQLHLDYSFVVPVECDKETIKNCLNCMKECSFELLDEYSGSQLPKGKKSITFRAKFFEDENPESIDKKTKSMVKGLGFAIR